MKYIDVINRLDREEKERQSRPIPFTFEETLTLVRRDTPPPNYQSLTMAEGGNPGPTALESLRDFFPNTFLRTLGRVQQDLYL